MRPWSWLAFAFAVPLMAAACTPSTGRPDPGDPAPAPAVSPNGSEDPSPTAPLNPRVFRFSTFGWTTDFTRSSVDLREIFSGGPGKDGIPAIDDPRFESIAAAREWLTDQAPVIVFVEGGEARAYPIAILIWHEIVNDTVGGRPVVVTYCPLCNSALVFERRLDGVEYDFGTTGNLRFSDLVMYDRQTESWWQQFTGDAIVGVLTGARLEFLPAQMISLGGFAQAYPAGMVLSRETGHDRPYGRNPYAGYDAPEGYPFLFEGSLDERLSPMERVVALGEGSEAIAFPYSELSATGLAEESVAGDPVVVFWVPGTASPLDTRYILGRDIGATGVFRPEAGGRSLTFLRPTGPAGPIVDAETGSTWTVTGVATSGDLAGAQLEAVVHGDHFWFAWAAFVPETRIWRAP
jgi:hypothetical protein